MLGYLRGQRARRAKPHRASRFPARPRVFDDRGTYLDVLYCIKFHTGRGMNVLYLYCAGTVLYRVSNILSSTHAVHISMYRACTLHVQMLCTYIAVQQSIPNVLTYRPSLERISFHCPSENPDCPDFPEFPGFSGSVEGNRDLAGCWIVNPESSGLPPWRARLFPRFTSPGWWVVGRMETAKPQETGKIVSLQERGDPFWDEVRGGALLPAL